MREQKLKARAKINLGLDVLRKREDGYHELRMVMQTIDVWDEIHLAESETPGIRIRTNHAGLPTGEGNLVWRAAHLLMEEFEVQAGLEITLEKRIPVAAGLAGGSADAAAVLIGVNELFGLGLTREELQARGVRLGADIPYCILQGTALAEGIGERLTPLPQAPDCRVLLVKPPVDVSTGFVYGNLKADRLAYHPDIDGQIAAIQAGDFAEMAARVGNVLETVTIPAHPVIDDIKQRMLELGAVSSLMSGSGPSVFGLFDAAEQAEYANQRIKAEHPEWEVFLTGFYFPEI